MRGWGIWRCQKVSAHVDGVSSRGSSVCRPGSKDPHQCEQKFEIKLLQVWRTHSLVSISTSQEYVIQGSVHEAIGLKASIHIGLICFLNHSVNNQYNISNCCQFGFWDGGDNPWFMTIFWDTKSVKINIKVVNTVDYHHHHYERQRENAIYSACNAQGHPTHSDQFPH